MSRLSRASELSRRMIAGDSLPLAPCALLRLQVVRQPLSFVLVANAIQTCRSFRFHSTSGTAKNRQNDGAQPEPKPGVYQILRHAARFEPLRKALRIEGLKSLYRQSPEETVLALVVLFVAACMAVYAVYTYFNYFYSAQFTSLPDPVAKAMRRALYYSNYNQDDNEALKYYHRALTLCKEFELDPFADEITGLKIQVAKWLEKTVKDPRRAAAVLEAICNDLRNWVKMMDAAVAEEKVTREGELMDETNDKAKPTLQMHSQEAAPSKGQMQKQPPARENLWHKRNRLLKRAVGIAVKLGDLYAEEHVVQEDKAHEWLMWATNTALGELKRRGMEGVKPGEGDWMTAAEIGGTLESLGNNYEAKGQCHLALPLFYQALRLCAEPCHIAVLMNNIAVCFAQHPFLPPERTPINDMLGAPIIPANATQQQSRVAYLDIAKQWAENARRHAEEPKPGSEERTSECDEAGAASLCTLGTVARLSGDKETARMWYEQGRAMGRRSGAVAAAEFAQKRLKELE